MKTIPKYQPSYIKIVPWEEIEKRYVDLISCGWKMESMLNLVKHIKGNNLDKRLFAYTSLDKLIVTIYNPGETGREELRIQFDQHTKRWHFEYYPKPFEPTEMERFYPEEEGINKFCEFIEWLKW